MTIGGFSDCVMEAYDCEYRRMYEMIHMLLELFNETVMQNATAKMQNFHLPVVSTY